MRRVLRRFGLGPRLVVPIVLLALATAAGLSAVEDLSSRRQTADLLEERGSTMLGAVTQRLSEQRRNKEVFAQLATDQPELVRGLQRLDAAGVSRALATLRATLGVDRLQVFDRTGQEILHHGPPQEADSEEAQQSLARSGLAGLTRSSAMVTGAGLEVVAGAPVKSPGGIVGSVVVAGGLDSGTLRTPEGGFQVQMALFKKNALVSTTTSEPGIAPNLAASTADPAGVEALNQRLRQASARAFVVPVDHQGAVMAIVYGQDLASAADSRKTAVLMVSAALLLALLSFCLVISRAIVRPLARMVGVAREMLAGNYGGRLSSSPIPELDELGGAINHLAEQVEDQLGQLSHQAFHDPLTNLPNRALFVDRVRLALARQQRNGGLVAVLFLDIDDFKTINDALGHSSGDQVLTAVGLRLGASLRSADTAARLGGDEFAILLEGLRGAEEACLLAERVLTGLGDPLEVDGSSISVNASIGIALSEGRDDPRELLRNADVAMYKAKGEGKGRYAIFESGMHTAVLQRLALKEELQRAVQRDEFIVHYQPIVDLSSTRIVGMEALVRWEHPGRGLLEPAAFIAMAEETGLIVPIGRHVLTRACGQARQWQEDHGIEPPLSVSVNLSARQLHDPGLVDDVRAALSQSGLDPCRLTLEITESMLMADTEMATLTLGRLKELGVVVALDDFGTGYSSLSYLDRFPVDVLKIDKSFVDALGIAGVEDPALLKAIIRLGHMLHLSVVAEGIERGEQLTTLQELSCGLGQGYYFSRPVDSDAMDILIATTAVGGDAAALLPTGERAAVRSG